MKAKISLMFLLSLLLLTITPQQVCAQSAGGHVKMEKCPTCGKLKQNCPYKGNHPKCQTCGKVKEQCQYKGKHPKCQTCGKVKEQCPYKGEHPKCQTCGKIIEDCPYNGEHPKPQPATGTLSITSTPSDAVVKIDGEYMGTTPLTLSSQMAGTYKVTFSAEGYETTTKSVTVSSGKAITCSATLEKKQASLPGVQSPVQQPPTTTTTTTPSSSQTFTANGVSFNMILVEGGTFTMGATSEQDSNAEDDEKPTHQVSLSTFYIGETEVTQELWQAVMGKNPSKFRGTNRPVENVSWKDCQKFISKLSSLTGKNFRLPTEAEWEYAARGGNKSRGYKYSGSNKLDDVGWYYENSGNIRLDDSSWDFDKSKSNGCCTHPIKQKTPNELGIYDMSGNVLEWCENLYDSSGSDCVFRGGSWLYDARRCRVSLRILFTPFNRFNFLGLRLAL